VTGGRGRPVRKPEQWDAIRQRLDAIGQAIAGTEQAAPERVRQVLEERARALARPGHAEPPDDTFEVVLFDLEGETYALEANAVWEVFRLEALSPLPGARPPVFGVTSWRGAVLTILDLRQVLGLTAGGVTDLSRVILLGTVRPAFGILADAVRELVVLRRHEVREPPQGVALKREYLAGITGDAVPVLAAHELLRQHAGSALPGSRFELGG
jgi:purine-binding chemotaxis protein CheW